MILAQILIDLLAWVWDHREEVTLFGVINFIAVAMAKRIGMKQLQELFGRSETRRYIANQRRIEAKIDYMFESGGGSWPADISTPITKHSALQDAGGYMYSWAEKSRARFAKRFTIYIMRRRKHMNKFKSRKFWMAIIAALLPVINDQFNIGLNTETVIASIGAIVAFILGEAHVDAKRAGNEVNTNGDTQYQVTESNK